MRIQVEPFAAVAAEVLPLAQAHWDEVEAVLYGPQKYTLNADQYRLFERLGALHLVTARVSPQGFAGSAKAGSAGDVVDLAGEAGGVSGEGGEASAGVLAGYAAFVLAPCPHRSGQILAVMDALYLVPEVRQGFAALRLLRHALRGLGARGAHAVQFSSPQSRPCDALFRRLGARTVETLWQMEL